MEDDDLPSVIISSPMKSVSRPGGYSMPDARSVAVSRLAEAQRWTPSIEPPTSTMAEPCEEECALMACAKALAVPTKQNLPGGPGLPLSQIPWKQLLLANRSPVILPRLTNTLIGLSPGKLKGAIQIICSSLEVASTAGDPLCGALLLILLLMDPDCRAAGTSPQVAMALRQILSNLPADTQISELSHDTLLLVEDAQDRCEIAEWLRGADGRSAEDLARHLLSRALTDIAGAPYTPLHSLGDLRGVLRLLGPQSPRRQLAVLRALSLLRPLLSAEPRAQRWLLAFVANFKCSGDAADPDVFKVKAMCAHSLLLWQDPAGDSEDRNS